MTTATKKARATPASPVSDPDKVTLTCVVTGKQVEVNPKKDGEGRLPLGWKRIGDKIYSPEGKGQCFVPRALTLSVASAICTNKDTLVEVKTKPRKKPQRPKKDGSLGEWTDEACEKGWAELHRAMRISQQQASQVGCWIIRELMRRDTNPLVDGKLSKFTLSKEETNRLRASGRREFPDLDSQSFYAIEQRVVSDYKDRRFDVWLRCADSFPTFRMGDYPVPVPDKDAELTWDAQGQAFLALRISGRNFKVRLRAGKGWRRQLTTLATAASVGQRSLDRGRDGQVLVTFSCLLPRQPKRQGEMLVVRTDPEGDSLLIAERSDKKGTTVKWNEDCLVRWVAAHKAFLQRMSEDLKYEKRHPRDVRDKMLLAMDERCHKQHCRVMDRLHKVAASVAGLCQRRGVSEVSYDDTHRGYIESLPWFRLKQLIKEKLDILGIDFNPTPDQEGDGDDQALLPVGGEIDES